MTSCEVTWGHGRSAMANGPEDLDALLDAIDAKARELGLPQDVMLTRLTGEGSLGVVVGADRSVLNHVPADANPPYMSTIGDQDEDRPFTFYVAGDHHSEVHWRHTVPLAAAREAARHFLLTGRLDERLRWTEI
jgi:hypothetical protein